MHAKEEVRSMQECSDAVMWPATVSRDYSQLPEGIILKIAGEHLDTVAELIAFSGVCKLWRTLALEFSRNPSTRRRRRRHQPCLPGLFVSQAAASLKWHCAGSRECGKTHDFFPFATIFTSHHHDPSSPPPLPKFRRNTITLRDFLFLHGLDDIPSDRIFRRLTLPHFPEDGVYVQRKYYLSSKDGWLLLLRPNPSLPLNLYLLNPITKSTVPLPPLPLPIRRENITTAILSSSPDNDGDECYVFVLFQWIAIKLAWCKAEVGNDWEFMSPSSCGIDGLAEAATYSGGNLYVTDGYKLHILCNITAAATRTTSTSLLTPTAGPDVGSFHLPPGDDDLSDDSEDDSDHSDSSVVWSSEWNFSSFCRTEYHLTNLRGQLLMILRHPDDYHYKVYKLDGELVGDTIDSDHSCNHYWTELTDLEGYAAFVGSHQAFTLRANCGIRGNCIYYVRRLGNNQCGVYNLGDQKIERFGHRRRIRTFWFQPMPRDMLEHEKDYEEEEEMGLEDGEASPHQDDYVIGPGYRFKPLLLPEVREVPRDDHLYLDESDDEYYEYRRGRKYYYEEVEGLYDETEATFVDKKIDGHVPMSRSGCRKVPSSLRRRRRRSKW